MTRTHRALCVATTALLLLTACGGDNGDDADGGADAASPEATAPDEGEDSGGDGSAPDETEAFASAEIADVAGNPIGTLTAAEADEGVRLIVEVQDLTAGFHAIAVHENGVCETQSTDDAGQVGDFYSAGDVLPGAAQEDSGVVEGEDELAETPGEESPEGETPDGEIPEEQEQAPGEGEQPPPPQGAPAPNAAAGEFTAQPAGQLSAQGAVPPQPETQPQPAQPQPAQPEAQPQPEPETQDEIPRAERAGALPNLLINEDGTGHLEVISARLSEEALLEDEGAAVIIYTEADHHGNVPERYAPYGPDAGSLMTGDAGQRAACGVLEPAE